MHPTKSPRLARQRLLALALPVSLALVPAVRALDGAWNADAGGNWNTATTTNWTGAVVAEGADFTATFSANITSARTVTLTAPLTIGNLSFTDTTSAFFTWTLAQTGSSVLTLQTTSGTPTVTVGASTTAIISGLLGGNQGLAKAGSGRLVLSGNNATTGGFTGPITVSAGTLDIQNTNALASSSAISLSSGTTLDSGSSQTGNVVTIASDVSGAGRINKTSGASTLFLTGNNTHSGGTTLTDGRLGLGAGTNNGLGTGTLTLTGGSIQSSDNNSRTIANALSFGSNNISFGATQGNTAGLGDLTFTSTASIGLGGSKNWTVTNGTTVSFANNWSGNTGWNVTKLGTGTLIFNGNLTSSVGVAVSAGVFTLNGASNTYSGATTVNGGVLYVNGAKTGSGVVTVNSTGTLAGVGSVAGAATAAAGSFLSAGSAAGSAGTLTFTGALDVSGLASGAGGLVFDLGAVGFSDKIVAGALTIGTGALDFADFGFSAISGFGAGTYTLIDATSIVGTLGSNLSGTVGGLDAVLSISGNDLVLTVPSAIPEPASFATLAGVAMLGCAALRRRRHA